MALEPRDQLFRTTLALSVAFHGALFFLFVLWTGLSKPSPRFIPVAVVDLVSAPGPPARPAEAQEARPAAPAKAPSRGKAPALPRAKPSRERTAKAEAPRVPRAEHPNSRALSESIKKTIRKMKEEKESQENVREAIRTLQREKEQRAAVAGVRERVARRVDLSPLPSPPPRVPQRSGGVPGGGGAVSGVSPELQAYTRELWEKIYESWVPPVSGGEHKLPAVVRIKIEKDGRATNVRIEESSQNRYFDESVLRAIRKASPLPLPPGKLRENEELYDVVIRFSEPPKGQR